MRATQLKEGDGNAMYFHNYANMSKFHNTIWELRKLGRKATSFDDLSEEGIKYFEILYQRENIAKASIITRYFSSFVSQEQR